MLSRQIRVLVGVLLASTILVFLAHSNGYDFDHRAIFGGSPSDEANSSNAKHSQGAVSHDEQKHEPDQEQLVPEANPTDAPALQHDPVPETNTEGENFYSDSIDWTRFAYVQYVTNDYYLCNAAMLFEALHKLGSKAERLMMYPEHMMHNPNMEESLGRNKKLLIKVRDEYNVKLVPIKVQHRDGGEETWSDSYTKLLAFNQTQYDRIIALDSDALLLQSMDELFFMPPCPIAMPRAYWLLKSKPPKKILATHVMVIQPSAIEFSRIEKLINTAKPDEFDMELINKLYLNSAAVLPHRPYALLTAEFREKDHKVYLGSDVEEWDPKGVLEEAKFVHFSDWPVQKPWLDVDDLEGLRREHQPKCKKGKDGMMDCEDREVWNGLYKEFRTRRGNVCGHGW